jgi:hypothetical protein
MASRTCKFRDCSKPAVKGWTMCKRHHSAGGSIKQEAAKAAAAKKRRKPSAKAQNGGRSVVLMPTGTRSEVRIALARMTEAERKRIVPPGVTGLARTTFIKHGLSLADQLSRAEQQRMAEELEIQDTSDNHKEATMASSTKKSNRKTVAQPATRKRAGKGTSEQPATKRNRKRTAQQASLQDRGNTPALIAQVASTEPFEVRKVLRSGAVKVTKGKEGWSLTRKQAEKVIAALQA